MIHAQGGDPDAVMPLAPLREAVLATKSGFITSVDALVVGVAAWRLGAGRARKEDPVSATAGVLCLVREGDKVDKGQPLFELHADDEAHLAIGRSTIHNAAVVGDTRPASTGLLLDRISN